MTVHDESGLAAAVGFYEQGGTAPAPVDPPTIVLLELTVAGVTTAKVLANDLTAQLIDLPNVSALQVSVTEPAEEGA